MKTPNPIHQRRSAGLTIVEVLVGIIVVVVLLGFLLPVFSRPCAKGRMTDSLNNAKQIGTALKMYAGDHDGRFPFARLDDTPLGPSDASNRALENLMPKYSTTKKLFFNKTSAWCAKPAVDTSADSYLLKRGQNDWNYIVGLVERSDARWPLVTTATISATDLTWSSDTTAKGGVWGGTDAVIVYADGSAKIETCNGSADPAGKTRTFFKRPGAEMNILTATPEWLGAASFVLAPE